MIMLDGRIRLEGFRNLAIASSKKDPVKSQVGFLARTRRDTRPCPGTRQDEPGHGSGHGRVLGLVLGHGACPGNKFQIRCK